MSVKQGGVLVGLLIVTVAFAALWYRWRHPPRTVGTGTVRVESTSRPGAPQTLRTRTLDINGVRTAEVELPNGTWVGCAGDCAKAAREAGPEFWDAMGRDRGR